MNAPIDLGAAYDRWYSRIGADRGDEGVLHASDVGGCFYATYTRLAGMPQIPKDEDSRAAFLMGFAVEDYVGGALAAFTAQGYVVTKGREIAHRGLVGHLDYDLEKDGKCVAVIDVRTTKSKFLEVKHDHALKSAFYADHLGAEWFCEWVFSLGFGKVSAQKAFWLRTADYLDEIEPTVRYLNEMAQLLNDAEEIVPRQEPPRGETWRCDKGYCDAPCFRNAKYVAPITEETVVVI
jgi:hypothetical protein